MSPHDGWDLEPYQRLHAERARPFFDLGAMLQIESGMRVPT